MSIEYEYRECLQCSFIEDCPHPDVDQEGKPIPPRFCIKSDKVQLIRRVEGLLPKEYFEDV